MMIYLILATSAALMITILTRWMTAPSAEGNRDGAEQAMIGRTHWTSGVKIALTTLLAMYTIEEILPAGISVVPATGWGPRWRETVTVLTSAYAAPSAIALAIAGYAMLWQALRRAARTDPRQDLHGRQLLSTLRTISDLTSICAILTTIALMALLLRLAHVVTEVSDH